VKIKNALLETAKYTAQKFDESIRAKNAELENQEENIRRINGFLEQMLDVGLAFKIEPGSQEYLLERKISGMPNVPAKNLSEGEKNIVAFLYFLVSLDFSSAENKKDEIIVIDDPVSSLDSNNLFVLQNLVVKTLKAYGQQFFLMHNFYFFAKIRESLKANIKAAGNKVKMEIFEIKSNKGTGSLIKIAGKYVKSHISEYMSIMEALHEKWKTMEEEKDVATGNLIRRVLEVFLCFKDTDKEHPLFYKLQNMAGDDVKYQSLLNMGNAFSHTEVGENADFSYVAGKEEIGVLFNFMNKNDPEHLNGFGIKLSASAPAVVE
jgi:wobble nucleotide-excising tRNase